MRVLTIGFLLSCIDETRGFCFLSHQSCVIHRACTVEMSAEAGGSEKKVGATDNKAMAFLRKKGRVGGTSSQDFINSVCVDEGPAGKTTAGGGGMKSVRKARSAYVECTKSGVIDDLSETFPFKSSGTEWTGYTDRVMGGMSSGSISREMVEDRMANVLRGKVSLANNGGFVQMATDLALDPAVGVVDASAFDGIELDVFYQGETNENERFNVHIKTPACQRQFSSYRATFEAPNGSWKTVRLPWSEFIGKGPGAEESPFDPSALRRLGVVAIGKEMDVFLAVSGIRFYSVF